MSCDSTWNELISNHVRHAAVETAGHLAHNTSVPTDIKVRRPSFAFRRIQEPAKFRLEQVRLVFIVVRRTAQSAFPPQHLGVRVDVARHQFAQPVREMARRPEVADVEVDAGRHKLRVVGDAEHDTDDVAPHCAPELLGDVVDTETVLERQVEEVSAFEHVQAEFGGAQWALERPTTAVYVNVDEPSELRHVTTQQRIRGFLNDLRILLTYLLTTLRQW